MLFRKVAIALLAAAILALFVAVPAVTAGKETAVEKAAAAPVVMHDFGVTLFPTYRNDARPTCALQSPNWIYHGEKLKEEQFNEL